MSYQVNFNSILGKDVDNLVQHNPEKYGWIKEAANKYSTQKGGLEKFASEVFEKLGSEFEKLNKEDYRVFSAFFEKMKHALSNSGKTEFSHKIDAFVKENLITNENVHPSHKVSEQKPEEKNRELQRLVSSDDNLQRVKELIGQGADVNTPQEQGFSLLHQAIYSGANTIAKLLIESGADLNNNKNWREQTPLITALSSDIGFGPPVKMPNGVETRYRLEGEAYDQAYVVARLLIEKGGDQLNTPDDEGKTPLFHALDIRNETIAKLLIETEGVDLNAEISHYGRSCIDLITLLFPSQKKLMSLMVEKGARPSVGNLLIAIYEGDTDLAIKIINICVANKTNLDVKDRNGRGLLHTAIKRKNNEIVKLLISKGVGLNLQDKKDRTPLHFAIEKGNSETAKLLIESDVDLNLTDYEDKTPLVTAIKNGNIEIAKLLIERGANLNIEDDRGRTPLFYAVKSGNSELVRFLIKRGATFIEQEDLSDSELSSSTDSEEDILRELAPVLVKLAEFRDPLTRKSILKDVLEAIKKPGTPPLKALRMAEAGVLAEKIRRNECENYPQLLIEKTKISRGAQSAESKARLKEINTEMKSLQERIKKADHSLKTGDVWNAKVALGLDPNEPLSDSVICSYLIGLMAHEDFPKDSLKQIIHDLSSKVDLKDVHKHRLVVSALNNMLKKTTFVQSERIAVIKKIMEAPTKTKQQKEELLKAFSKINTLLGLDEVESLKTFVTSEKNLAYLKEAIQASFQSKLNLEIENINEKYDDTFGDPKQFRDQGAIFIYLASLNRFQDPHKKREAIRLFSKYIEEVLKSTLTNERYNLESNPHLKKVFEADHDGTLLKKWKEYKSIPAEMLVKNEGFGTSTINFLKSFQEKMSHNHLESNWREYYPFFAQGLVIGTNIEKVIAALEEAKAEIKKPLSIDLEEKNKKIASLEAQKSLLLLCKNERLNKVAQIELLKSASQEFAGTEFENDLNGLVVGLSSERRSGFEDFSKYTVCDTDDPCDILLMGYEIKDSCQRLDGNPKLNSGLLGPLLDGKYRIIAIKDENGKMVARCLLRILWDEQAGKPVLFKENFYINNKGTSQYQSALLNEMCKRRALEMGFPLLEASENDGHRYENPVSSKGGRSSFEYVDALRGIRGNAYEIPVVNEFKELNEEDRKTYYLKYVS